jgi:hypothetical protein
MTKFTRNFIVCVLMLLANQLTGQNYLEKTVSLPAGQVTLKTALNSLSKQSGCIFSYDPTKILDKQIINISSKGCFSLRSALIQILPKDNQFKLNGKYVVLQKAAVKTVTIPESTKKQVPAIKTGSLKANTEGRINEDATHERLVLPPLANESEASPEQQNKAVSIVKQAIDSTTITQSTKNTQQADTLAAAATKTAPDSFQTVSAKAPIKTESKPELNEVNTDKKVNPTFSNFISKNGTLETALSFNKKLAALSINAGLYNVYSIFSIGSDYNKSYHLGIGIGYNVKIDNHFGINLDLAHNSLMAGKSYSIGVRATNTQLTPEVNYAIGSSFKIVAGPSFYLIRSKYLNGTSTSTDLGKLSGIGFTLGLKINLMKPENKKT